MKRIKDISILLVDDDDMMRSFLRVILREVGAEQIHEVGTADKALKFLMFNTIDLVFLDINLPDADGVEFVKVIKENQPDCEVLMVSGEVTMERVQQITNSGAKGFIAKPFSAKTIEKKVTKILTELININS